jgi:hypothetical protein
LLCKECDRPIVVGADGGGGSKAVRWVVRAFVILLALVPAGALGVVWWTGWLWDQVTWPNAAPIGPPHAGATMTVHVAWDERGGDWKEFTEELAFLADDGHPHFMDSAQQGDRGTIILGPVSDPDAFVRGIDFATVYRAEGRVVTIAPRNGGADRIAKALAALNSDNPSRRKAGLRWLLDAKPGDHREKVARALEARLNDPDAEVRKTVVQALGVWGTKESVTPLLNAVGDRDTGLAAADTLGRLSESGVLPDDRRAEVARALEGLLKDAGPARRDEVIRALGRLKDEGSAELLAQRLDVLADRQAAGVALRALGPAAEKAVVKRLRHEDTGVRWEACGILGDIGTPASIPALKELEKDRFFPARIAEDAIRRITARHGVEAGK